MELGQIAAFWAVSILFVITPGADWAYAITAGLRYKSVFPAVSGLLCGHLAATGIVAAGVGTIVAGLPMVLTVLTVLGSGYLVWLGVGMLTSPPVPESGAHYATGPWWSQVTRGFGVSGLNPKVFLLFLALLPQFTNPTEAWPVTAQILTLGFVHTLSCAVVYLAVGFSARKVLSTRPAAARVVTRISGTAMIIIGTFLLLEQLIH